jgi:uncharacterized protein YbcI
MKTQRKTEVALGDRSGRPKSRILDRNEIETALCEEIVRFEQDYVGRRPERVQTHLRGDILLVRLHGVVTAAERQLAKASPAGRGLVLLKQMRDTLVEANRQIMEAIVEKVTGAQVLSLHHDLSTVTGEEVLVFILAETPLP